MINCILGIKMKCSISFKVLLMTLETFRIMLDTIVINGKKFYTYNVKLDERFKQLN